jgi:lipoprotein Spr
LPWKLLALRAGYSIEQTIILGFTLLPSMQRLFTSSVKKLPGFCALLILVSCGPKQALVEQDEQAALKKKGISFRHSELEKEKEEEAALKSIPDDLPAYGYSIRNKTLYEFIKEWEGTPHRMGGNSQNGVDCSGLVCALYTEVYQTSFTNRSARDIYTEVEVIEKEALQEGDLVFFKIRGRHIDHIGVYLNDGRFVHTSSSRGVMVSSLEEPYFKKCFFAAGRKKS